jgi:hypothetical protein
MDDSLLLAMRMGYKNKGIEFRMVVTPTISTNSLLGGVESVLPVNTREGRILSAEISKVDWQRGQRVFSGYKVPFYCDARWSLFQHDTGLEKFQ